MSSLTVLRVVFGLLFGFALFLSVISAANSQTITKEWSMVVSVLVIHPNQHESLVKEMISRQKWDIGENCFRASLEERKYWIKAVGLSQRVIAYCVPSITITKTSP